jgi:hypothetical protein
MQMQPPEAKAIAIAIAIAIATTIEIAITIIIAIAIVTPITWLKLLPLFLLIFEDKMQMQPSVKMTLSE